MPRLVLGILLIAVLTYGGVKAWPLVIGPRIVLLSPDEGALIENSVLAIQGNAAHAETLTLNGTTLLMERNGNFSKTLTLPHGGVILSLTATDRFGRTTSVRRTIFVP